MFRRNSSERRQGSSDVYELKLLRRGDLSRSDEHGGSVSDDIFETKRTWRRRASKWFTWNHFYFILGLILGIGGVFFSLSTHSFFTRHQLTPSIQGEPKVCFTSTCIKAAARILALHRNEVNPCEDFYAFSCGKFVEENAVPDDSSERSTFQEMKDSILLDVKKLMEEMSESNGTEANITNPNRTSTWFPTTELEESAVQKAKYLYSSCMRKESWTANNSKNALNPIFNILDSNGIGQWPILQGSEWNPPEESLERLLALLFAYQVPNVFELIVIPEINNKSMLQTTINKGNTALAEAFFLHSTPDFLQYLHSYKQLLEETIRILKQGKQISPEVDTDIHRMIDFEKSLSKLVSSPKCHSDMIETLAIFGMTLEGYNKALTLEEIREEYPQVNWTLLVQEIFETLELPSVELSDVIIFTSCPTFFKGLMSLVAETERRTIMNYLIWRFVFHYLPYLGVKFDQIWTDFMKNVPHFDENTDMFHFSRWKQCASNVNKEFGVAVAYLYSEGNKMKSKNAEGTIQEILSYLKKAFGQAIEQQLWIPAQFKEEMVGKLMKMGCKVGYPQEMMNITVLNEIYADLQFSWNNSLLLNMLEIRKFHVTQEIRIVQERLDEEKAWQITQLSGSPSYDYLANNIVLPLGILRYPLYDENYPMYINFASLGFILGQEMVRGFDDQGLLFDKDGSFQTWWPKEVHLSIRMQARCFVEQYGKFKLPLVDHFIAGSYTLEESIRDAAALHHSWLAYQMWAKDHAAEEPLLPGINFTVPQVFFLRFGQIWCELLNKEGYQKYINSDHSPGQFRVLGATQNNIYFGNNFNCSVGSPMNPERKCRLWS